MIGWADALQLVILITMEFIQVTHYFQVQWRSKVVCIYNSPHPGDWNTKEDLAGLPCADPNNYNDRYAIFYTRYYNVILFWFL